MKKVICLLTAIILVVGMYSACGSSSTEFYDTVNEKVIAYLDAQRDNDIDTMFQALYPDTTDIDTYYATINEVQVYCPISENYTLEMQQYDVSTQIGGSNKSVQISYILTTDAGVYYLTVIYVEDSGGSGFQRFSVVSREDYEAYQKSTAAANQG